MDEHQRLDDTDRAADPGDELGRLLRAYAGARLSPDQWASARMRASVIERGHSTRRGAAPRIGRLWLLRRVAFVGLVGVLAVATGAEAAVAASPGGPLYGARLWVENAVVTINGGGADLRVDQMDERIDEITTAVDDDNSKAANAAGDAYGAEVAAAAQAAQDRTDLLSLRATIARHLAHLQDMAHASPKAQANLDRLIQKAVAALAEVDRKLAALPAP